MTQLSCPRVNTRRRKIVKSLSVAARVEVVLQPRSGGVEEHENTANWLWLRESRNVLTKR
jgi:beta-galactosidase GanA